MARKSKEDADKTRQAILASALQTFYEKGFSRGTFDEIASRINLTKGAVYWHFRNKTDIISAIIKQKIAEWEVATKDEKAATFADLRNIFIRRAQRIENSEEIRRFLFFVIYHMEWSKPVLTCVWKQLSDLSGLSDKRVYDCLQNLQAQGELSASVDIAKLQELLMCLWKGCIDSYISGCKNVSSLADIITQGFDAIMSGIKVEKK